MLSVQIDDVTQTAFRVFALVSVVAIALCSSGCSKPEGEPSGHSGPVVISLEQGEVIKVADAEHPLRNINYVAFSDVDEDDFVVIDGSRQIAFFDEYEYAFDLGERGPGPCESEQPFVASIHEGRAFVIDRGRLLEFDLSDGSCVRERTMSSLRRASGILQSDTGTFLLLPALPGQDDVPILFTLADDSTLTGMSVTNMDAPRVETPFPIRMAAPLRTHEETLFFTPAFGTHMVRVDLRNGDVSSFDLKLDLSAEQTFDGLQEFLDYLNDGAERASNYFTTKEYIILASMKGNGSEASHFVRFYDYDGNMLGGPVAVPGQVLDADDERIRVLAIDSVDAEPYIFQSLHFDVH